VGVDRNANDGSQPEKSESNLLYALAAGPTFTVVAYISVHRSSQNGGAVGFLVAAGLFFMCALAGYAWFFYELTRWVRKRREERDLEDAKQTWTEDVDDSERRLDPSFVLTDATGTPEAKRKWRRRRNIAAVLGVVAVLWTVGGVRYAITQHAVPFTAKVDSEQCSGRHCDVFTDFTTPNGEPYTQFEFDPVSQSRIHVLPSGQRVLTLYWFPSNNDYVDTETGFWYIVGDLVGIDFILVGAALVVLYSGRKYRRQAKQPAPRPPVSS
jgi:hypothetical protein